MSPKLVAGPDPEVMNLAVPGFDALGRQRIFFWPQNHIPDKFWAFVGTHTQPIDDEDVRRLQSMLRERQDDKLAKYLKGTTSKKTRAAKNSARSNEHLHSR
jgi:hypothetical protein